MAHELTIGVFDWGTSKIVRPDGTKINWTYRRQKDRLPLSYFPDSDLDDFSRAVMSGLPAYNVLALCGFGHSLEVSTRSNGSRAMHAIIGDDPSLTPQIGDHQKWFDQNKQFSDVSALRKVAGLVAHTNEVTEKLFGKPHDLSQLRFSTALSWLAWQIAGERDNHVIFPADAKDFNINGGLSAATLLSLFGLASDQLEFLDRDVVRSNGVELWVMQDFGAERKLIAAMADEKVIPVDEIVYIASDSILKRLWFDKGQWKYDLSRMMGNTGLAHIYPIFIQRGLIKNEVGKMFNMFEMIMRKADKLPKDWFFDPRANNEKGQIFRKVRGRFAPVTTEEVSQLPEDEFIEAIQAYGIGMACSIYDGIKVGTKKVGIYGGLMCLHGELQPGFSKSFILAAPKDMEVTWLMMPDSSVAMRLHIKREKGEQINYAKEVPQKSLGMGGGMIYDWLAQKEQVNEYK